MANSFLVGFALDGGLSALDELLVATGFVWLSPVRQLVALFVLLGSVPAFAAVAFDSRLPKRAILPPIVFLVWNGLGALPWPDASGLALALAQLLIGGASLFVVQRRSPGGHWLLTDGDLRGPAFRFAHTLRFALATALVVPPALLAYGALSIGAQVERLTAGYMSFDRHGIQSTARVYRRGDREIHLVGMMHIGEDAAYHELFESFAGESTIVLEEGVSDREGLLGEGLFYDVIASRIGLDVQPSFEQLLAESPTDPDAPPLPDVRNADIDASEFQPETIALLDAAAQLYRGDDLSEAIRRFQATVEELGPDASRIALADIIGRRNLHLLGEIETALADYERIVVPWGALHLPDVEKRLIEQGFAAGPSTQRPLADYRTVARALFDDRRDDLP